MKALFIMNKRARTYGKYDFRIGKTYEIETRIAGLQITVQDKHSEAVEGYSSVEEFMDHWQVLDGTDHNKKYAIDALDKLQQQIENRMVKMYSKLYQSKGDEVDRKACKDHMSGLKEASQMISQLKNTDYRPPEDQIKQMILDAEILEKQMNENKEMLRVQEESLEQYQNTLKDLGVSY